MKELSGLVENFPFLHEIGPMARQVIDFVGRRQEAFGKNATDFTITCVAACDLWHKYIRTAPNQPTACPSRARRVMLRCAWVCVGTIAQERP
jgi:hypothetical protein